MYIFGGGHTIKFVTGHPHWMGGPSAGGARMCSEGGPCSLHGMHAAAMAVLEVVALEVAVLEVAVLEVAGGGDGEGFHLRSGRGRPTRWSYCG